MSAECLRAARNCLTPVYCALVPHNVQDSVRERANVMFLALGEIGFFRQGRLTNSTARKRGVCRWLEREQGAQGLQDGIIAHELFRKPFDLLCAFTRHARVTTWCRTWLMCDKGCGWVIAYVRRDLQLHLGGIRPRALYITLGHSLSTNSLTSSWDTPHRASKIVVRLLAQCSGSFEPPPVFALEFFIMYHSQAWQERHRRRDISHIILGFRYWRLVSSQKMKLEYTPVWRRPLHDFAESMKLIDLSFICRPWQADLSDDRESTVMQILSLRLLRLAWTWQTTPGHSWNNRSKKARNMFVRGLTFQAASLLWILCKFMSGVAIEKILNRVLGQHCTISLDYINSASLCIL